MKVSEVCIVAKNAVGKYAYPAALHVLILVLSMKSQGIKW
jgi:hypothetical protein